MRREAVVIPWGKGAAALLTMGIMLLGAWPRVTAPALESQGASRGPALHVPPLVIERLGRRVVRRVLSGLWLVAVALAHRQGRIFPE
jgi:hypothetical protein